MSTQPPIACDMTAIDDDEHEDHLENGEAVFEAISEIQEIDNGYAFKLPPETELIQQASAFIAKERLCCPFFEFSLNIGANRGPVWLRLTGREEVKPYIKENLLPRLKEPVTN